MQQKDSHVMSEIKPIKRALVSVYDKTGLDKLVKTYRQLGLKLFPPVLLLK